MANATAIITTPVRTVVYILDVLQTVIIMETVFKGNVNANQDGQAKTAINKFVPITALNMANAWIGNANVNLDGKVQTVL
jgi:hypothetical protein